MRKMIRRTLGLALLLLMLSTGVASANVRINEIAWMGSAASSTAEWIELANTGGSPVDLSGWHIEAEDGSPNIPLSGTIGANGYFLIERTNDLTVPNVPADLVASFGTGLSNSGETLRLKDTNAAVVDTVVGGTNWMNIGGNNNTKETAQFTPTGWVTGAPTPRAANVGGSDTGGSGTPPSAPATSDPATGSSGVASGVAQSIYPRKNITVSSGEDQHAFVGFPATFLGSASGLYDEVLSYATYHWNFGDGATGEGNTVSHTYLFPGDYVVTLEVFWGQYHNMDRLSVSVTGPEAYIKNVTSGESGFIELANRSLQEIDLASWSLRAKGNDHAFIFPPHTILLSEKTLVLPNSVTRFVGEGEVLELAYPNSAIAFVWSPPPSGVPQANMNQKEHARVASVTPVSDIVASSPSSRVDKNTPATSVTANTAAAVLWTGGQTPAGSTAGLFGLSLGNRTTVFLLVVAMLLVIFAGVIVARSGQRSKEETANEYAVIEDIIEGEE